jgi:ABC-type oligopeptide transport system substrate-binding subunit
MKTVLRFTLLSLVLVLVISLAMAQDDYKILRTRNGETDQPTMDPNMAQDAVSIQTLLLTMPGVTIIAADTGEVMPGIASAWENVANEDGTVTWTFHFILTDGNEPGTMSCRRLL